PTDINSFMSSHSPLLVTVGLLESEYDLPLQIEVLGLVLERSKDAGLLIIGSGSLEAELRKLIASKPYAGHILLTGDVPHHATIEAIANSDLFLRTTFYDGDSISVREALHLDTPVIATDNAMRPAGVKLIPPANVGSLRQAIEECLRVKRAQSQRGSVNEENIEVVWRLYQELTQ